MEMTIKQGKGKDFLDLGTTVDEFIKQKLIYQDFRILSVELAHLRRLAELPLLKHKDPFDRLLISQAISENLALISCDNKFADYPVKKVW